MLHGKFRDEGLRQYIVARGGVLSISTRYFIEG
jgi:hypothetical protein